MVRQNSSAVNRKYLDLKHKQQTKLIKLLRCNKNASVLKAQLSSTRAVETMTRLRDQKKMKTKLAKLSSLVLVNKLSHTL